ncbi:MAG TPA: hypothetical protein VFM99_04405 [Chitinophagales bacterium]|nr:hypothetical protein [Chitinophagales bacterium]
MKNKINKVIILILIAMLFFGMSFFQSCYYDNAEELLGTQTCDTAAISFSQDVVPILETNCYACHSLANGASEGSGYILEGYDFIVDVISTGQLVGAVNWSDGFSFMPKNASQLPACERALITSWVNQGALNN